MYYLAASQYYVGAYVDAAYCYTPSSVGCLSVTTKTAEPIEITFGIWTRVGTS